jgi:hypothetical protein
MMVTAAEHNGYQTKARPLWWLALSLFFLMLGCQDQPDEESTADEADQSGGVRVVSAGQQADRLSIPVGFVRADNTKNTFSLVSTADTWTIQMTDCLSGYGATVTEANLDGLEVYHFDRGCLVKLTQFTYGEKTYVPTAGDPFTTWQAGDTATFDEVGEPGITPLRLTIVSTLGNPVSGSDSVTYGWHNLASGNDRDILWTTVGATGQIQDGGSLPPSFTIKSIELTGTTAGEGGAFQFVLECTATIGITNVCESVDFADLDYKLIEDTYGSSIDEATGDAIFATAGTAVTLPDDRVAPGNLGTTNGGIVTISLEGPDNMTSKPNMLLVIRSYGVSYQYFNADVAVTASY